MAGKFVSDKFFIRIWDKNYRWINEYQILVGAFWPIALLVFWAISLYALLGEGHPPKEVSGFYKLQEAPWILLMIVPGKAILAPIVRFRFYYFAI